MPFPIVPDTFIITLTGVPEVLADFSSARNIAKGVLSQEQGDGKLHLTAYDSRSLSIQETKYGITDLEMLAIVVTSSTIYRESVHRPSSGESNPACRNQAQMVNMRGGGQRFSLGTSCV